MQYKSNTKIIIDKRKLDTLFRIGCPDNAIISLLKTGSFENTGDSLIDENLESLLDIKEFKNWGGKRDNSGRKSNHLENQDEKQDAFQVVDKDKEKDKDKDKRLSMKKPTLQEVIDYCNERNNGVDANKWYDYYTANGWRVGRNPMKDWQATVRTWERKQEKPAQATNEGSEKMVLIDTTSFYLDDTMDEYKDLFEGVLNKDELALNVWKWIVKNFEGRSLKLSFIRSMIEKFKNEGGENERSIEKQ